MLGTQWTNTLTAPSLKKIFFLLQLKISKIITSLHLVSEGNWRGRRKDGSPKHPPAWGAQLCSFPVTSLWSHSHSDMRLKGSRPTPGGLSWRYLTSVRLGFSVCVCKDRQWRNWSSNYRTLHVVGSCDCYDLFSAFWCFSSRELIVLGHFYVIAQWAGNGSPAD